VSESFHVNRYRKKRSQSSEYKLLLQSAAAMLVSDYTMDEFLPGRPPTRRRGRQEYTSEFSTIQIGEEVKQDIIWGIGYIGLKMDNEMKLNFCINAKMLVDHACHSTENISKVFRCSIWVSVDILRVRLADQNGDLLKNFWFDEEITQGVFQPVVKEIKKCLQHQRHRMRTFTSQRP